MNPYEAYEAIVFQIKRTGMSDEAAAQWMRTANPLFGHVSPGLLVSIGKGEKVLRGVKQMVDENFTGNNRGEGNVRIPAKKEDAAGVEGERRAT